MFNLLKRKQPKERGQKSHIPMRLNILFLVIFILFVALIGKLANIQIADYKNYESRLESSVKQVIKSPSARGQIYDAKGKALVTNIAQPSITYTRGQNVTAEEMKLIAVKLANLVEIKPENLTKRDKIDFYLATDENYQKVYKRLSEFDKKDKAGNLLSNGEIYAAVVNKVTKKEYNHQGSHSTQAAYIFKKMNGAAQFSTVTISSKDISTEDIAKVGENGLTLTGVGTGTSWVRKYNTSTDLRSILGTVSTEQAGLPAEKLDEYLAKGYSRNDRVGTSYLEEQYESYLQGVSQESEIVMNQDGDITKQEIIKKGAKGKNLKLTIDLEFQQKVEDIMKKYFNQALSQGYADYSPGTYVVVMNNKTGGILAMVGLDYKDGQLEENPLAAMFNYHEPGSTVKGATLTAGYETGVLKGNDVLLDQPIKIKGTNLKASVFNPTGNNNMYISAKQALEYSSNDYMMKVTLKMLGLTYTPDMTLPENNKDKVYGELRKAYAQYGLGIKTGIDLPKEEVGLIGSTTIADAMGKLLDLSFGQYDAYSALQLANYAATVANSGKRPVPHVVEGIYDNSENGGLGKVNQKIKTKIANTVPISKEQMSIIQEGFYDVVHGNNPSLTTGMPLANAKMSISAKTGTAEKPLINGKIGVNSNVIAYAPSDKPEVSIGLLFPQLTDYHGQQNLSMTREIVNLYYDMYYSKK